MHWLPKRRATSLISSGRFTAAVLIATLSAPARRMSFTSSIERRPPATVMGTNTSRDAPRTMSPRLLRPYRLATVSTYNSSSAPAS